MRAFTCSLLLLAIPAALTAQGAAPADFESTVDQLDNLHVRTERSVIVQGSVLGRDAALFRFDQGSLQMLTPVNGRDMAAAFGGKGTFTFVPATAVERARLAAAFDGQDSLAIPIQAAVFYFADSTPAWLGKLGPWGAQAALADVGNWLGDARRVLDPSGKDWDPDLMAAALNGDRSGLFYAWVVPEHGHGFLFEYDPASTEPIRILRRASYTGRSAFDEILVQSPAAGAPLRAGERTGGAVIDGYRLDVRLPEATDGSVGFTVLSTMTLTSRDTVGPWVPLYLASRLKVDSARADSAVPVATLKDAIDTLAWVRLPHPLSPGAPVTLTLAYHGDLIDRYGDWFFVNPVAAWYPRTLDARTPAAFEITYHSPVRYPLASVGRRVDSTAESSTIVRTRWVTDSIRNASFNLGDFSEETLTAEGTPPVTFLYSDRPYQFKYVDTTIDEDGHPRVSYETITVSADRKHRQEVGQDVQAALKFYTHAYGPLSIDHLYAGEIPYEEGLAFPGMIDLSDITFSGGNVQRGEDQVFRAHEVGHQWWGIGVDFAGFRDQWLSEGLAEFSGLWFAQTALHDNKVYFGFLDRYRDHIKSLGSAAGPMAIGYRAATPDHPAAYQVLTYEKGAWLAHMLRILMLDFRTMNEDRFTAAMHDYYQTYRGGRASTADLQRVMEQHLGIPLDWFFRQYYEETALPSYRTAWKAETGPDGKVVVHLRVEQSGVPDDFENYIPVSIDLGDNRIARLRIHVKGPTTTLDVPGMPAAPKAVTFNDLSGVLAADFKSVGW